MKDIDLSDRHTLILGKKNQGKSYFMNYLMSISRQPYLCFDPMREHQDYSDQDLVIEPEHTRGKQAIEDLEDTLDFLRHNRDEFGMAVIDEVNRFHSKGGTLDGAIGELCDFNAHWNLGVMMAARRPASIHTDLRELSEWKFIFRLTGQNDVRTLDGISRGLGERVASLDSREFMVVDPNGSYWKHEPISAKLDHNKGI